MGATAASPGAGMDEAFQHHNLRCANFTRHKPLRGCAVLLIAT